jgi:hypothetical protein
MKFDLSLPMTAMRKKVMAQLLIFAYGFSQALSVFIKV